MRQASRQSCEAKGRGLRKELKCLRLTANGLDMTSRYNLFDLNSALKSFLLFPEGSVDLAVQGSYSQVIAVSWNCSVTAPGGFEAVAWNPEGQWGWATVQSRPGALHGACQGPWADCSSLLPLSPFNPYFLLIHPVSLSLHDSLHLHLSLPAPISVSLSLHVCLPSCLSPHAPVLPHLSSCVPILPFLSHECLWLHICFHVSFSGLPDPHTISVCPSVSSPLAPLCSPSLPLLCLEWLSCPDPRNPKPSPSFVEGLT